MPRRIAVLFEFPTLNGGERSMLQSLESLGRDQFDLVALAPERGRLARALRARSIEHYVFECRDEHGRRLPRPQVCSRLEQAVLRIGPDLVHANSLSMGRLTGAIAGSLAVPCVAHLRDIVRLSGAAIADLNRNRLLLAVSAATRRFHLAQGLEQQRTEVIYNGVDTDTFRPCQPSAGFGQRLGLPASSFVLVTIGQLGLRKGHDVLAAAAEGIVSRVPQAHFLIVGQRDSAKRESIEFERDLHTRFTVRALRGRLHCTGYRTDVPQLLNQADLLLHPAKQEPLGRVLLEAAACEVPIVATAVGGTEEILSHGVSAVLIPPADPRRLTEAVVALAHDETARRRLASAARQRVRDHFSAPAAAERLADAWRRAWTVPVAAT